MSSSTAFVWGFVFLAGAILFIVGSYLVRWIDERRQISAYQSSAYESVPYEPPVAAPEPEPVVEPEPERAKWFPFQKAPKPQELPTTFTWTLAFGVGGEIDAAERLDMIERLAMLGEPWCIDALKAAAAEEKDPAVVAAIERALPTAFY